MAETQVKHPILVAYDGSATARSAALLAIQIAQSQRRRIHGLYVIDDSLTLDAYASYSAELGRSDEPASRAELVKWFGERGETVLQWLEARCRENHVPVTTEMMFGGVSELITQAATEAQLLALGRRGLTHADAPGYLGRNFRAIAHHARCPVLAGGDTQRPAQRILLAYNGSERARHALNWTALLQRTLSAEVIALAVKEEDTAPIERWLTEVQEHITADCLARYGQPAVEIVETADENQIDLIVMGSYRHTALLEWLVGSTVDRVLRDTTVSVLIV